MKYVRSSCSSKTRHICKCSKSPRSGMPVSVWHFVPPPFHPRGEEEGWFGCFQASKWERTWRLKREESHLSCFEHAKSVLLSRNWPPLGPAKAGWVEQTLPNEPPWNGQPWRGKREKVLKLEFSLEICAGDLADLQSKAIAGKLL